MIPSYFTLTLRFATPSFVYVSYLHELLFQLLIFWRLRAFSLRRALRQQWKKRLLCSEGFCVAVKKPLHFLYVQHGRAQNEHAES